MKLIALMMALVMALSGGGAVVNKPGKCDMLIIAVHPDDDVLYFGGIVATYAQDYNVQVVFVANPSEKRRKEAIEGQRILGNPLAPDFSTFRDVTRTPVVDVDAFIAEKIQQYQPLVVVTHDLKGEYGHPAHKIVAASVLRYVESGKSGVLKCYLHLYPDNQWKMDLNDDTLSLMRRAFKAHKSQQNGHHEVTTKGVKSCLPFGLAYSVVGEDEENNFMEGTGWTSVD